MRPGILVQHRQLPHAENDLVRGDVLGVVGVVHPTHWPEEPTGTVAVEALTSAFEAHASSWWRAVDATARQAVTQYFGNGGTRCNLIAIRTDTLDPSSLAPVVVATLESIDDVALVAMPVLGFLPDEAAAVMWVALTAHARTFGHRFVLIDPPDMLDVEPLLAWVRSLRHQLGPASSFAAVYHPWVDVEGGRFPPSGSVGGIYARMEAEHAPFGAHWPPANASLSGVAQPAYDLTSAEIDQLTQAGINPLVVQPGRGVVVWGVRTLSDHPTFRFVNSRRVLSAIEEQLRRDAAWVVFESHRPALWETLARTTRARLDMLWRLGILVAAEGEAPYVVKCDAELNPPAARDAGEVHLRVTLQPVAATERIVLDLQWES